MNIFIKILYLPKGMQLLIMRSSELIFLLILLHVEFKSFSRLSSESMMIPNKVSAVLEVIVVALINTT